jgi:predicted GIY-YIG superfamily endonuclease
MKAESIYYVYVIQSDSILIKNGMEKSGPYYVGCTTNVERRVRQHNGLIKGGAKYTSKFSNWKLRAVYGPYYGRSEAMKAEWCLKHTKRGISRTFWSKEDSPLCKGLGREDPLVPNKTDRERS